MQTLRRVLVATAAAALAAPAAAADQPYDSGYTFTPPDGLAYNQSLSIQVAKDLAAARHYDGLKTRLGAEAYVADGEGLAFYVIWVHATEPTPDVALAVRRTFDQLRQAPVDDTAKVQSAELVSWSEDVSGELAVGDLEWRHVSNETVTRVRAQLYVTPEGELRQVRGECVMRAGDADRLRPRCEAAIAALQLTHSKRGGLGAVPSAGTLRLSDPTDGGPMLLVVEGGIDAGANTAPSLRPPTQGAVLYEQPARSGSREESSSTFLYVGGAALLIVALYVLTRRSGDEEDKRE